MSVLDFHPITPAPPAPTPPPSRKTKRRRSSGARLTGPVTVAQPDRYEPPATVRELCARFQVYADKKYRKPNGEPTGEAENFAQAFRALEYTIIALDSTLGATGTDDDDRPVRCLFDADPNDIEPDDLEAVGRVMIASDLAIDTINGRLRRIKQAFRWGVGKRYVDKSVLTGLEAVEKLLPGQCDARVSDPKLPVPDDTYKATVAAAMRDGEHNLALALQLQYHTGMRSGELIQMAGSMIDQSRRPWVYEVPRVQANTPRGVKGHKTDRHKRRLVALFNPARELLTGRIQFVMPFAAEKPLLLNGHRAWTPNSYRTKLIRICERHGIPEWTPHDLRRSFATRMEAAYGVQVAQLLLGHSSPRTTEGYVERDLAAAFAKLEAG
ncbi:MAG: tyrosine-type recombinase/integrase [Planctomycetota bacterium]